MAESLDFLVTGDAVNVSARLQQGANPDEIIASDRTAHAAQNAFLFEEERFLQAKGKPQPLRVFPLKGPRPKRLVERPPFVGRRQDLLQLDMLKERALEEQRPQLISIVAPAGTGKSRLLEEFLQHLDPADGFRVAFSRCLPYGQTLTFWPLRGLLARDLIVQIEHELHNFRHILIRDVAYGTLTRSERIRLHSKIALWLAANAGEHLDEYIELIAYHYGEAIQLSRQSAVPLALPFKTEDAASIFARAGVLDGHTGSYAEAKNHMQLAIDLSSETECLRLYEQLGDSVLWGDIPNEAYRKALECWRAGADKDPLTGARLIRKVLIASTWGVVLPMVKQDEAEALREEALGLIEMAGDEHERWQIRLTACFDPQFWDGAKRLSLLEAITRARTLAEEAGAYFERQGNWEALSRALDASMRHAVYLGDTESTFALSQKQLTLPNLSPREWSNAVGLLTTCYYVLGDYENCIASAKNIFAHLKPGQSIAGLGDVACLLIYAAFTCGRWEEIEDMRSKLDEIKELVQYDQFASAHLLKGYLAILWMALAREDRPLIDAMSTMVRKYGDIYGPNFPKYIEALLVDDLQKFSLDEESAVHDTLFFGLFQFFGERGKPLNANILKILREMGVAYGAFKYFIEIALALEEEDNPHLTQAIDEAETHQHIVHAARMRIVLAQRTGDLSQLERARPVLEKLGDRMHLRKLEEVAQRLE